MPIDFHLERVLVKRLKTNQDGATFLFGSAFSQNRDGAGIPNVEGVLEFIEEFAEERDFLEEYLEDAEGVAPKDRYQEAFNSVAGYCGQNSVNEIVRRVVKSNIDEHGNHRIPQAVKDFVTGVKNKNFRVTNIITTNFDTLLEEEFKTQGISYNSYSVVSDTQLPEPANDSINIYHLHGIWDRGDTMHTTNQLQSSRERIETSLQNIIGDDLVVIMGYSGWEDSFTRSLASVVINPKSMYDILWCFYESDAAAIEYSKQDLFDSLDDAITRGRVQFFNGVDCNAVFDKLSQANEFKKKELKSTS
ncbi:SIR2 family protein [Photobacterium swingsii]|uniref:SIR2 family protein n=1 Tax=Photobacterium swingsii TaxID=680026 RepID=UPI00352F4D2E